MFARFLAPLIAEALRDTPVVLLDGARQTGKSTLVRSLIGPEFPANYLTFDDLDVLAAARADPIGFIGGLASPVVLDEIQRVPDLFLPIKATVDRDRRPGRFLLTGSTNVFLAPRLADSLAGRIELFTLWPLSQGELRGSREGFVDAAFGADPPPAMQPADRAQLVDELLLGGFPEPRQRAEARRAAWFRAYLTTIIQRDIRDLANIEGLTDLPRLLALIAARSAQLLNVADLARDAGLSQTTLKRYLAILERTFLVYTVPAWACGATQRVAKAPKIYLADSGLTAALLGLTQDRLALDAPLLGPLLESFVMNEIIRQSAWSETRPRPYHFRLHSGREVDIVLEDSAGRIVGIEVKSGATATPADFAGLRTLAETAGERFVRGILLTLGSTVVPFGNRFDAMPASALWTWGARPAR